MSIDLIVIGHELIDGRRQDANTKWLGSFLKSQGLSLRKVHLIGDDKLLLRETLDESLRSSQVVIFSGGLGPTQDDLTKDFLAEYFNKSIRFSPQALNLTIEHYARIHRDYREGQNHYPHIPEQFEAIQNLCGLAPGLLYQFEQKLVLAAPGVPREFQSMLQHQFLDPIKNCLDLNPSFVQHINIRTYGQPEEKIFSSLVPNLWQQLEKYGRVSSLPHLMGVDIGVQVQAHTQEQLRASFQEIQKILENSALAQYIWQIGDLSLEQLVLNLAKAKQVTLGFCESCTGGLNAHRMTNLPGCSEVFIGSLITYANSVKTNLVGVDPKTIAEFGAVSCETVRAMAINAQKHLQADLVVATSGIAGPTGGSPQKPIGSLAIGVASQRGSHAEMLQFRGDREVLKRRFSEKSYFLLWEILSGKGPIDV